MKASFPIFCLTPPVRAKVRSFIPKIPQKSNTSFCECTNAPPPNPQDTAAIASLPFTEPTEFSNPSAFPPIYQVPPAKKWNKRKNSSWSITRTRCCPFARWQRWQRSARSIFESCFWQPTEAPPLPTSSTRASLAPRS